MSTKYEVVAYQVATTINIRQCKSALSFPVLFWDSEELYLENGPDKFIYIFQYGMVSFFNHTTEEIEVVLAQMQSSIKGYNAIPLSETIAVEIQPNQQKVSFDLVILPSFDAEALRLVMLNTSQSVALDRYSDITEKLIEETHEHTTYLERKGRLDISGLKLRKFIGKVLNIKNQISQNLYIFDEPEITWENEELNRLNHELKQTFDLKNRYRSIYERTEIIKENLELFKDIMYHRESSRLEWIIIILILVEVLDLFVLRLIK